MPDIQLSTRTDAIALIRNEPVQARSTARLAALLDAAAQVVHEIGYERLTTAMVAERAGASIGTVYRYFPDRIAVLQSLAARNAERMTDRVLAELRSEAHADWESALSAAFGLLRRGLPRGAGVRLASLRRRARPAPDDRGTRVLGARRPDVRSALVERFSLDDSAGARAAFGAAVIASDAIAAHAFVLAPTRFAGVPRARCEARLARC